MREAGLWHAELVGLIVSLRHHDTLVIADAGLPVPAHVPTVDLGWARGEPRLLPVLGAVAGELVIEAATVATEADERFVADTRAGLGGVPIDRVTHEEFKARCAGARAIVRTGEDLPYANVLLHAGVPFGDRSDHR
jgi:D-ribose pyranase